MIKRFLLLFIPGFLVTALSGASLTVTVHNGSSHTPASAELVELLDLNKSMQQVAVAENVSGSVVFDQLGASSQQQFAIQVRYLGVTYSSHFTPDPATATWQQSVTVFDTVSSPVNLTASVPFYVIYAFQDRLYIQKRLVVNNLSDPPVSYYDPAGSIRIHLPSDLLQLDYLTVKNGALPFQGQLIDSESGQLLADALKPGPTEIDMAYYLSYDPVGTQFSDTMFYDVQNMHVYTMPMDLKISLPGLQPAGTDQANGVAIYTLEKFQAGAPLQFTISGQGLAENQEQQSGGRIVVESRMDIRTELALAGVLILLLLSVLIFSLIRQQGDLQEASRQAMEQRKNTLLQKYAELEEKDSPQAEALLNQLIAVYKTLERI